MKKSLSIFACTCLAATLFAQQTMQRSVFFETNQSVVQPQFKKDLQAFSDSVKRLNDYSIVLKGHTDAIGSNTSNQKLSLKRVQNVQLVLEKQGIPNTLIKTVAFGKEMPIADNATETGKQNNRRVDIIVTFNDSKVASAQKYNNMLDLYKDLSQKAQLFKINTARVFAEMYNFYKVNTFNELRQKDGKDWDKELEARVSLLGRTIDKNEYDRQQDSLRKIREKQQAIANEQYRLYAIEAAKFANAFPLPTLGWINCDQFANYPGTLVQIETDKMTIDPLKSQLILAVPKRQLCVSALSNNIMSRSIFSGVPENDKAFVIGMKLENGQPYLSFSSIKTANMIVKLDFKALSVDEIKEKLKLLDNG